MQLVRETHLDEFLVNYHFLRDIFGEPDIKIGNSIEEFNKNYRDFTSEEMVLKQFPIYTWKTASSEVTLRLFNHRELFVGIEVEPIGKFSNYLRVIRNLMANS